jgi:ribokinase
MPLNQKPVVVVGSINIDLVASSEHIPMAGETVRGHDFRVYPGGKGANQAVAVGRLGHPVCMTGKVGTDTFGEQLMAHLEKANVDVRSVEREEGPSGVAMIAVSSQGENSIVVIPGANAHVTPDFIDAHRGTIHSAGIVLAQLEVPIETVVYLANLCEQSGVPLMLDPAPAHELPSEIFSKLLWFTPNETEAAFFSGLSHETEPAHIAQKLLESGVKGVALKLGARGVYLATADGISQMVPSFSVQAVDTTAAGDAWNGAFATALLSGKDAIHAAQFATAAAAVSVTRPGAQSSMPSRREVEKLLAGHAK